nr:AMP-binding protein [Nocardia sp. 348MFTsu5.1]
MDLAYLPWRQTEVRRERVCLRDDRGALTYAQADRRVAAIAEQFAATGFGRGDVVAIMLPNRVELVLAILAAWRLGAAATPINPAFTEGEAGFQIEDSGASLLIAEAGAAAGITTIVADDLAMTAISDHQPVVLEPEDLALLVYTSGSTGKPKGVMQTHQNVDSMATIFAGHLELTEDDHCMLILPLFHANALMVSTFAPLSVGGQLSIVGSFSPRTFFDHIERLRPTYFSAVPTIYALLAALPEEVRPDTSSLRFVVCGAAPVSVELLEKCSQRYGFEIIEGYGLTETTCGSACNPVHGQRKPGTVGPALSGLDIRVVRADGSVAGVGEPGEVQISGPTVMRGYLGKPDATADTIIDGWLRTGDIGRLDDDGYLTLVDRLKDMIIRGGENIYPKEIENILAADHSVLEAAVVGRPDPIFGEVPVAYVTLYPGSSCTTDDLIDHCRRHLTRVKVPESITIVEALPKNPVGKINKPELRRALQTA